MSDSTDGSRSLSAEEARWKREAEGSVGRIDGEGRMALLVLEVLATLEAERANHEQRAIYTKAMEAAGVQDLRTLQELRARNERLAAQVDVMQRAIEAAKVLDSAWIAILYKQDDPTWQRQRQASLAFWDLVVDLEQQERSRAESEARTGEGPTEYPKEADDGE